MSAQRRGGRPWKETQVRLSKATATLFDGPDGAWLFVVNGVTRQTERRARGRQRATTKGAR